MNTKQNHFEKLEEKTDILSRQEFDNLVVKAETAMPTEAISEDVKDIQDILTSDRTSEKHRKQKLNNLFKKRNKELEKSITGLFRGRGVFLETRIGHQTILMGDAS